LAIDFMANHKRQFSKILAEPDKIASLIESDDISIGLAESISKLIKENQVDKAEAARSVAGNASVYEKIRNI